MKFFHTSDWHLGRIFHNRSLLEDQKYLLDIILKKIDEFQPDAFLLAGDVYDRSIPPSEAIDLLNKFLEIVCFELKVPMLMIPGNHDSIERLRFGSKMMKEAKLHIFGSTSEFTKPVIIKDTEFYGLPFLEPEAVGLMNNLDLENQTDMMKYLCKEIFEKNTNKLKKVLISHCFVSGGSPSESERPISIGGIDQVSSDVFSGFDYVALGHLHAPQYINHNHIRYSGSLMKYSFSEVQQKKGFTVVDLKDDKTIISEVQLQPIRDMVIKTGSFEEIYELGRSSTDRENYLLIKLTDKKALFEPMAKLREIYPNILQIEKIGYEVSNSTNKLEKYPNRKGELERFKEFYFLSTGTNLSDEYEEIVKETINSVLQMRK